MSKSLLVERSTVNTIPPATFDAFRDHGHPRESLTENLDAAKNVMQTVAKLNISMDEITDKLTDDGVRQFEDAFDKLLAAVERSSKSEITSKVSQQTYKLPDPLAKSVKANIDEWRAAGKVRRLWQRDASLWTGDDGKPNGWAGFGIVGQSQPSHFGFSSSPVQSEASRCHSLRTLPAARHSSIFALTDFASGSGNL